MAGFRRFRVKYFLHQDVGNSLFQKLATGQTPKTLVIGCSDSRVDPAIITDASPGELFVIRNVANLVPPCETSTVGYHGTSSGIEFAVLNLKVENVIVMGHRFCGGIRALMTDTGENSESFVPHWVRIAQEAKDIVMKNHQHADHDTQCQHAEMESIKISLRNLRSFPFIQEAIQNRGLNLIGVYFDIEGGLLWEYDDASRQFRQIDVGV